jgi:hypothetical protein
MLRAVSEEEEKSRVEKVDLYTWDQSHDSRAISRGRGRKSVEVQRTT